MRVWLLGGFRVSVGPWAIPENRWRLRKAASLIKMLALAPGHRLHQEQLMASLWPNLGRAAAANSLRYALHSARRVLAPDPGASSLYLRRHGEQIELCPDGSLWVDAEAFEVAAATARRIRKPEAYRAAVDLYAGGLLPEDRYEDWAEGRREQLLRLYLQMLVELAGSCEERGEREPAIEALQRVVASEPTHEEAHVGLMRLYAASGERHEAILQYEWLRKTLAGELGTEPDTASRHLYADIAAGRFPPPVGSSSEEPPGSGQHNLPAARTSFVGREREMVEIKRLLAMTRLLTLTGVGGSGKTRLALEVSRTLVEVYPDGVWLVELASVSDPELVSQAVAGALGVREQPERPLIATLVDALRAKRLLLVMDNCEHLVDAAARLAETLLDSCPGLQVLATSREVLGIAGEINWPVPTLSLPDTGSSLTLENLSGSESAQLFVERASNRSAAFALTPKNARAAAEICRRLDGIPLAIELAANRAGVLSVEQISERLKDSLGLLTGGGRTATPRQQTLRGALDWSHELLSGSEKMLFSRLSVFSGGWTLETAEAVCSPDGVERDEVLDLISSLVDKSLVVVEFRGEGGPRYKILEPVRHYARERLEASGAAEEVRRRHAAYFLALAEEANPELMKSQQRVWFERLDAEHDNLRAALSWALERGETELGMRLGAALWEFWLQRRHLNEGRRWLEAALARGGAVAPSVRAETLRGAGRLAGEQGDKERELTLYEEALALYRESRNRTGIAVCRAWLGWSVLERGEFERAARLFEESLKQFRDLENLPEIASTLVGLAHIALETDDLAHALALWEESLALFREAEDSNAVSVVLNNMGWALFTRGEQKRGAEMLEESLVRAREVGLPPSAVTLAHLGVAALSQGDPWRATALFKEVLTSSRESGSRSDLAYGLEGMAMVAGVQAKPERAARLGGAAERLHEVTGARLTSDQRKVYEPYLASARSRLDEAAWQEAWAEGRAMRLEEVVRYALSTREELTPPTDSAPEATGTQPLTRREREVAALVARGLTNRLIASELVISVRTVNNHVANILKKLGVHSREQIPARIYSQHHFSER